MVDHCFEAVMQNLHMADKKLLLPLESLDYPRFIQLKKISMSLLRLINIIVTLAR